MSVSRRPNGATTRGGRRSPSTGPSQRPVPQAELGLGRRSWTALGRDATTSPQPNLRDEPRRQSASLRKPRDTPNLETLYLPRSPAHSHGGLRRGGPNRRRAACQRLGERPTRSPKLIDGRRRRSTDATGDRKNKRETDVLRENDAARDAAKTIETGRRLDVLRENGQGGGRTRAATPASRRRKTDRKRHRKKQSKTVTAKTIEDGRRLSDLRRRRYKIDTTRFVRLDRGVQMTFTNPPGFHTSVKGYIQVCIPWISKDEWHAFSCYADTEDDTKSSVPAAAPNSTAQKPISAVAASAAGPNSTVQKNPISAVAASAEYPRRGRGVAATRLRGRPPRTDRSTSQVCIAVVGDWTRALRDEVEHDTVRPCFVCGPFTSAFSSATQADKILLVATGIGITAALQIIMSEEQETRRTNLIWMSRDANLVEYFLTTTKWDDNAFTLVYYTGDRQLHLGDDLPATAPLPRGYFSNESR